MKYLFDKKFWLKTLIVILEISALGLIFYLVALPYYPRIKYDLQTDKAEIKEEAKDLVKAEAEVKNFKSAFPDTDYAVSPNRLIIKKIGVNAPIVETENSDYGLSLGSWHVPESSTPDMGGNTVLTGHRFKYLPPNNLTFYLLNEMETGDIISVIWKDRDYYYRVKEVKIVPASEDSITNQTKDPILTLYTCDPIYSQKNRLVVIAELEK